MSHITTELMGFFYDMKTCTKCNIEKDFDCFSKSKKGKNGLEAICKCCKKNHYIENKELYIKKAKEYYLNNKSKIIERSLKYWLDNKEKIKERNKIYILNNKEKIKEYQSKYSKKNKKYLSEQGKIYRSKRLRTDPIFKLKSAIRHRIKESFKRGNNQFKKTASTEKILGCTIEEFIVYIKSKFTEGMSFDNYGDWHLDHIIPLALAKTEEEVIKLNHYTNFQPLWAKDNLKKGSKVL